MNDQQEFEAMLDRAGIRWGVLEEATEVAVVIEIRAKDGPRNLGYPGFVSHIGFDEKGTLVNWGIWE